jgi:ATP-dependent Clp protease adaptor protein ClpS
MPAPVEAPVVEPPEVVPRPDEPPGEGRPDPARPWIVIVWNDPVNLMSYVVYVFQKLFGFPREKATKLMLQVHHDGRAVVSEGAREKAEVDVARLHAHGLWATMQKAA